MMGQAKESSKKLGLHTCTLGPIGMSTLPSPLACYWICHFSLPCLTGGLTSEMQL